MASPDDLKYSDTHEWVRVEGDTVTIGITDHAQQELGDITFVELPAIGDSFEPGEVFGSVESVKAVSDLIAPVAGTVTAVNDEPVQATELVNQEPYGRGWMVQMKLTGTEALDTLMDATGYDGFLAGHEA